MNKRRMRLLERTLEGVIAEQRKFDMTMWGASWSDEMGEYVSDCGTSACAGGWLCRQPEAQAEGLSMVGSSPYYGGTYAFRALALYLDVGIVDAYVLFDSTCYHVEMGVPVLYMPDDDGSWQRNVTPQMVLDRVREYLGGERGETTCEE